MRPRALAPLSMAADFYQTLGVSRSADQKELKAAFRKVSYLMFSTPCVRHLLGRTKRLADVDRACIVPSVSIINAQWLPTVGWRSVADASACTCCSFRHLLYAQACVRKLLAQRSRTLYLSCLHAQ